MKTMITHTYEKVAATTAVVLFLFCLSLILNIEGCQRLVSLEPLIEHNGFCLQGLVFLTYRTTDIKACGMYCLKQSSCKSANFDKGKTLCELNLEDHDVATSPKLSKREGCFYISMKELESIKIFLRECTHYSCSDDQVCLPNSTTSPPLFTCGPSDTNTKRCRYLINGDEPLPAKQITASSTYSTRYDPGYARLKATKDSEHWGYWVPNGREKTPSITVKFETFTNVSAIATQGSQDSNTWITSYKVGYGTDCYWFMLVADSSGSTMTFNGNTDPKGIVINYLPKAIGGICFSVHVFSTHAFPALRLDMLSCTDF